MNCDGFSDVCASNALVSDKAERLLAEAASYGAQLVVFPEAFIGGYPRGSNFGVIIGNRTAKGKEEFRKYHASAIDVPGKFIDFSLVQGLKSSSVLFFPFPNCWKYAVVKCFDHQNLNFYTVVV